MGAAEERKWEPLRAEAERRGMSPRALRSFCRSFNIPIAGTHKNQHVRPSDIDKAMDQQVKNAIKMDADEESMADILATTKLVRRLPG